MSDRKNRLTPQQFADAQASAAAETEKILARAAGTLRFRLSGPEVQAIAQLDRAREEWLKEVCLSRGLDPAKLYTLKTEGQVTYIVEVPRPEEEA